MPGVPGDGGSHVATGVMEGLWGYTGRAGIAFPRARLFVWTLLMAVSNCSRSSLISSMCSGGISAVIFWIP